MKDRFENGLQQGFLKYLENSIDVFGGPFEKYLIMKRSGFWSHEGPKMSKICKIQKFPKPRNLSPKYVSEHFSL